MARAPGERRVVPITGYSRQDVIRLHAMLLPIPWLTFITLAPEKSVSPVVAIGILLRLLRRIDRLGAGRVRHVAAVAAPMPDHPRRAHIHAVLGQHVRHNVVRVLASDRSVVGPYPHAVDIRPAVPPGPNGGGSLWYVLEHLVGNPAAHLHPSRPLARMLWPSTPGGRNDAR